MILIDSAEPKDIVDLISQSVQTAVTSLNLNSMADYRFVGVTGRTQQINRTQAGELLSDIDSFEDELRRYYNSSDDNYVLVEGIISPVRLNIKKIKPFDISILGLAPLGNLFSYSVEKSGFISNERVHKVSYSMLEAWKYQIDKAGITILWTVNSTYTAKTIVALYQSSQKVEHSTLNRYYRPKIQLKSQNPHIAALMAMSLVYKLGIGEDRATEIIDYFTDLFNVLLCDEKELEQVPSIIRTVVGKLLKAVGRE